MSGQPVLLTISVSHYCEKARWALDRAGIAYDERRYLPAVHRAMIRRHGALTTPVLIGDEVGTLRESADIVEYADARGGRIVCDDPEARGLADAYDDRLGPATRLWIYHALLGRPSLTTGAITAGVSDWQKTLWRFGHRPIAFAVTKVLKIDDATAVEAERTFRAIFADVDERLADGRPYLAGDAFSIADLTFAALAAPLIGPAEYAVPLPLVEDLPPRTADVVREHRETPAGRHALKMFATERGRVAATA
ncbi:MAG TPA: glutathione S-transferase family protein [Baekduia sp.]|uniref:glutathione S-transferase family protein n=1 Tax=Baekduia sp. TaxID=2600305 RepID=UPI002D795195|nr:glutathione S-transferase family protein [Baekduia sp.]HET6505762.1 glutathione S-transferase family protein [Baekduia sp.]